MTTPSILPVAGPAPKAGSTSAPAGGGAARDFASLIAGLVAGPVGADTEGTIGEQATDGGSSGEAEAGPAAGSDLAASALSPPAVDAVVPPPGPAALSAGTAAEQNHRSPSNGVAPSVPTADDLAAGTVTVASAQAAPQLLDPGRTQRLSQATDRPPTQPVSAPQTAAATPVAGRAATGRLDEAPETPTFRSVSRLWEAQQGGTGQQNIEAAAAVPAGAPVITAPAATTAPTAAAQAPAPAPAPTAAQLVEPVAAVHRRGLDGTHTITVDITPDELGPVRVEVQLREGNVELRLSGHSEAARDALRAALPDLRRALEAAGVGTGSFQVSPDTAGGQQNASNNQGAQSQFGQSQFGQPQHSGNPQNGHARPAWAGADGRAPDQPEPEPTPAARPVGSLDLAL